MKLEFSGQIFEKKKPQISNSMKIRPVGNELFHEGRRTDGRADMTKLTVALLSLTNAPKTLPITVLTMCIDDCLPILLQVAVQEYLPKSH